jgi:NADH-quinone oxidoreductase subunit F
VINRTLDREPCADLDAYVARGGGAGLRIARELGPIGTVEHVAASGLRGRGGAGFPTGRKWQTVLDAASEFAPTPVVVNAAEGEPGSFKDRTLMRRNPYKVLEGALIAAAAVGAQEVIVAMKARFTRELARVERAIEELRAAALAPAVRIRVALGPSDYLFGEETALLEVVEGRQPFPRVTPPYRRGLDPNEPGAGRSAADVQLATPGGSAESPALVDNVETLANVPAILAEGPDWFRSVGTAESPGTVICTITGQTRFHGVGEYPMGTPLRHVIAELGGGAAVGHQLIGAISGVANALVPEALFDTALTYETMAAIGSGLGAAGYIVFDDSSDPVAIAEGIARFLAVESCGQCDPCKRDGLAVVAHLTRLREGDGSRDDVESIMSRLDTVTDGARCSLAQQQRETVRSLLALFPDDVATHVDGNPAAPVRIAPLVDIVGGAALVDGAQSAKQPDWSYGPSDSGAFPAALYGDTPITIRPPQVAELRTAGTGVADAGADPFAEIHSAHRRLHEALLALRGASGDEARRQLRDLDDELATHLDVVSKILYPTMLRLASARGDDVAWSAEHDAEVAAAFADRIVAAGQQAEPSTIAELASDLEAHIEDEQTLLRILRENLTDADIERLEDALAEARLRSTASGAERSSPPS